MVEGANKSIPSFLNFIKLVGNDIYLYANGGSILFATHQSVRFFINSVNLNIV
jgi:hypothetical protein